MLTFHLHRPNSRSQSRVHHGGTLSPWITAVYRFGWFALFLTATGPLYPSVCLGGETKRDKFGFINESFTDRTGEVYSFLVFLPYDYQPGEKRPLLLYLHGLGEAGDDPYITIHNNFGVKVWEMKRTFPFVVAIPQCGKDEHWAGENLQRAIDYTNEIEKRFGTDPDRCYVTGVSSGGQGAWNALQEYPDRFAAAAILCGTPPADLSKVVAANTPIWNFYNDRDEKPLVTANREAWSGLIKAGASPLVSEYAMTGHNCWDRAYRSSTMYAWLLSHNRSDKADGVKRFQALEPKRLVEEWGAGGAKDWKVDGDRVTAKAAGGSQPRLVCPTSRDEFELHVNATFSTAESVCRFGITDRELGSGDRLPLEIVLCESKQGDCGVLSADGEILAKLSPLVQRQLVFRGINDIRLRVVDQRVQLELNGAPALDMELPDALRLSGRGYRPVLVGTDSVRWQYVRILNMQ